MFLTRHIYTFCEACALLIRFGERGGPGVSSQRVRQQMAFQQRSRDHPHIVQLLVRMTISAIHYQSRELC